MSYISLCAIFLLFCIVSISIIFLLYNKPDISNEDIWFTDQCDYTSYAPGYKNDNLCYDYCYQKLKLYLGSSLINTSSIFRNGYGLTFITFKNTIATCSNRCVRAIDETQVIKEADEYIRTSII